MHCDYNILFIALHIKDGEGNNCLCIPFFTYGIEAHVTFISNIVFLCFDVILVIICIGCYSFLLLFALKQWKLKLLKGNRKRLEILIKLAFRLTLLMSTTLLSWTPLFILQIMIHSSLSIHPNTFLWVVISSLPANLIIDPILIIITSVRINQP